MRRRAWMLVFSSAEITKSPGPSGWPSQWPWYRSRIGPAFWAKRGSRGKIHVRWRHGQIASRLSQRQIVAPLISATRALRQHLLPDVLYGQPGQRQSQAVGQLTGEGFDADDETGGKAGLAPASGLTLEAGQTGQSESFAPFAHDLTRRVEASGDEVVGEPSAAMRTILARTTSQYGDVY